jgi:hypothetical protein
MLNTQYGREVANKLTKNTEEMIRNMRKNNYYPQPYGINYDDAKNKLESLVGVGGDKPSEFTFKFLDNYEDEVKKYSQVVMATSGDQISSYTPADLYKGFGLKKRYSRRGRGLSAGGLSAGVKEQENKESLQPFLNKDALVTGANPFGDTVNDLGLEKMKTQIKVNRKRKSKTGEGLSAGGMSAGGLSAGGLSAGVKRGRKKKVTEPKQMKNRVKKAKEVKEMIKEVLGGANLIDQNILPGKQMGEGKPKSKKPKGKVPAHLNKWLDHVKKVKSENPGVRYKEVLVLAKKNFK